MKERPILMSAPMVRACLDGTKTQTRRVVKPQLSRPQPNGGGLSWHLEGDVFRPAGSIGHLPLSEKMGLRSRYGLPGDRLYVRETFYAWGRWETQFSAKKGRDEWHFIDLTLECGRAYHWAATAAPEGYDTQRRTVVPAWWTRPAIHMPRAASRMLLDVTEVRVQRLDEISEADALAEGITCETVIVDTHCHGGHHTEVHADRYYYPDCHEDGFTEAGDAYADLWERINGAGSWAANPWVWAITFRRVEAAAP